MTDIQQDNIKDFAIAAFRYYGQRNNIDSPDKTVINAVERTMQHLNIENDIIALEGVRNTYCRLPQGKIRRGTITRSIIKAAYDMNVDERTLWRKLERSRKIFGEYYNSLLTENCQ